MILFGLPFTHNTITDFWRYKEFKTWCVCPPPHFNKKKKKKLFYSPTIIYISNQQMNTYHVNVQDLVETLQHFGVVRL